MRFPAFALLQLTRPGNLVITGLTVVVGGILAARGAEIDHLRLALAGLSAGLVAAGANALNDYYDLAIDLLNRPNRAIPSGRISRTGAALWGWLLTIAGIGMGLILAKALGLIAYAVAMLLWLYNVLLKRTPLWGNILVAVCGGLAFIYGGVAVGKPMMALIPAAFAFLIHLAREIVKDVEDMPGDSVAGARTLPVVAGAPFSLKLAGSILILLAVATIVPWLLELYSLRYLILVTAFASVPMLVIAVLLFRSVSDATVKRIGLALKIIMLTGLTSLYAG